MTTSTTAKKKSKTWWPGAKCAGCGRVCHTRFVIADDLENPQPYHKVCYERMIMAAMIEFYTRKK